MGVLGAAHGWGGQKGLPPLNLPHISYNDETWYSCILPKEDPQNMTYPLKSADTSAFSPEISNFCYIKTKIVV